MATILVTGATGFIGSHLIPALLERGHQVRAMTRHPADYDGPGEPVAGDVGNPESLIDALDGVEIAYYLVHSLASEDFEAKDAAAASAFSATAAAASVQRIVYLGGLGRDDEDLSPHLRSRRQVEELLGADGIPVTTLRAAVVIGHGGISWELTRQLVDHLPAMVVPRWVSTRTQPIALPDVIRYLTGVLDVPETIGQTYDIGGPEVLRYADMMQRAARIMKKRSIPMLALPLLTPRLSSGWLSLVTDVDVPTGRNLVDSMTTEVVVGDDTIRRLIPGKLLGYDDAIRLALDSASASAPSRTARAMHTASHRPSGDGP